jgi:hypothetical protein
MLLFNVFCSKCPETDLSKYPGSTTALFEKKLQKHFTLKQPFSVAE